MFNFSIIVLSDKNPRDLSVTMSSILRQNHESYEVIVLDRWGFSGVKNQLEKYHLKLEDKLRMIVCDNMNLTQAMNMGVKVARGKYLTFVESGMELEENSLVEAIKSANKYPQADATYGVYGPWEKSSKREMLSFQGNILPIKNTQFINLYYKKDLHQKFGFYNTEEKVSANYAFCLKAFYLGGAIVRPFNIKVNQDKELLAHK